MYNSVNFEKIKHASRKLFDGHFFFIWIDTKKNREPRAHKEQYCRDLSNLSCTMYMVSGEKTTMWTVYLLTDWQLRPGEIPVNVLQMTA